MKEEEEEEEEEEQEFATPAASCAKVLFRGRLLGEEEHLLYDVDEQASQQQQQLDVLPISGYGWDSGLVVGAGRQIAVNRRYICYCLRTGSVRILGRNVGSRGLFQGHPQRVTDMEFFAETVHLVASASSDGRLLVWRIEEDLGADDKFRLLEQVVLAIQFDGQWKDVQPRVCWHPHSQECLVMCIRDYVLKIDIKEARVKTSHFNFSAEAFVNCEMANLIGGVHCIGRHDSEVIDISVFSRDVLYIASASKDGMVRIWGGCEISPLAVFMPHGGQPVGSVTFFSSPSQPDEAVLLTRGTANNSLKLWVPASSNARLDKSTWQSVQTLEFKSSAEGSAEQAFLNQICIVPQAGLVLIGSSKKHAIYSVHINFGGSSDAVRMDYLAEFSLSMPIISLTAMADIGINYKGIVQVFCVQTQGIQQYFLNISHCLPQCDEPGFVPSSAALISLEFPKALVSDAVEAEERNKRKDLLAKETVEYAAGNLGLACEHNLVTDSGSGFGSWVEVPNWVAATVKKTLKTGSMKEAMDLKDKTLARPLSPLASGPSLVFIKSHTEEKLMSPHPSTNTSGSCMPTSIRSSSSRRSTVPSIDLQKSKMAEGTVLPAGLVALPVEHCHINSQGLKPRSTFITPSELMAMACFEAAAVVADKESKKARQQAANITLQVGSARSSTEAMTDLHDLDTCPGATGVEQFEIPMEMHLEQCKPATCSAKSLVFFEKGNHNSPFVVEESAKIRQIARKQDEEEVIHVSECPGLSMCSNNGMKRKSQSKNTESNRGGESADGCMAMPKSVLEDSKKGEDVMQGIVAFPDKAQEVLAMQISAMQESFDQLVTSQMELQRNLFAVVGAPLSVETERMHVLLEENMEKCFNGHLDSFWRQLNESKKDGDEFQLELFQHLQRIVTEFLDQEATSTFSNMLKAEVHLFVGSRIGQLISSNVDNVVATALSHNLEGCKEKIVKHVEKSLEGMLDLSLGGQVESVWITFLKHLMQDNLCSCFEGQAITKVEGSCANTTEHVHFLLYKGLVPVFGLEEQQLSCASLAVNLKDTLISLSSVASSLMEELQHAEKKAWNRGEYSHITYDISGELTLLLKEGHLEDAFRLALSLGNISVVSWVCKQVDPRTLFASTPPPLSQGVILSLAQQLALELGNDSFHKLAWIEQACLAVNPSDHEFALYMRSSLAQLYVNLQKQLYLFINDAKLTNQARLVMHIINSLMTFCIYK